MYTICIAEDEYYVQRSIEARLRAMQKDIEIAGCAFTGDEARELYDRQKPDIFLVDISMPQCSGLEFIEKIRREDPQCQTVFVIISGYSDYENMRKAIEVNVFDYLRKPIVPAEFAAVMEKAFNEVERSRNSLQDGIYFDRYLEQKRGEKISGMLLLAFLAESDVRESHGDVKREFHLRMQKLGDYQKILFRNIDTIQVLYFPNQILDKKEVERIFLGMQNLPGIETCAFLYYNVQNMELEKSLHVLERELNYRFFRMFFYREAGQQANQRPKDDSVREQLPSFENLDSVERWIRSEMEDIKSEQDAVRLHRFFRKFIAVVIERYMAQSLRPPESLMRDRLLFSTARFGNLQELEEYMISCADRLVNALQQQKPKELIDRICQYIDAHFGEPLNINVLADTFYLSPGYLSHYFKNRKNQTVMKYVEHVRLKKAAELLKNTDYTIADIAERVGYVDANYFTKVFRKSYGMSPGNYRNI